MSYLLIVAALCLLTAGQLLQKLAATRAALRRGRAASLPELLSQRETWLAMVCLCGGAMFWVAVLFYTQVGKAYPVLSLGIVFVVLVAQVHLREKVSRLRWLGVAAVVVGVAMVAGT